MEKEIRNEIRKMVEAARSLLEQEIQEQLEGVYGLHKDGTLEDLSSLPQTKDDQKAIKAREGFEYFIKNDVTQGVKIEESVKKLILGLSFTHLNRIIALKLMERRKVIKESVSRKTNSNGFKFYLADFPEQEELWRSGKEDEAYKNFLLHQYGKISEEIHVLFDPEDVSNLVFPRPRSLYSLLDLINQDSLADVWEEDETIGWIYQYFTPKELREKARAESAAPRNSYELAFRNQFYTPRYVVRFLTDNTLGRIWYEMQKGETGLAEVCEYMVKRPNEIFLKEGQAPPEVEENTEKTQEDLFKEPFYIPFRTKKDPRDIKILDPACGSGHFLLYCFDLMLIIYEEAYNDPDLSFLLKKDYPSFEEYRNAIPGLILRYNLHGIDIDLRASQIASLAVWLRAQRDYQEMGIKGGERPKITKSNIVCAEPMPGDKNMLEEFKRTLEPAVLGDLVKDVWDKMKLAGEAGSLLKIERMIKESVAEAEEAWRTRPKEIQLDLYGNEKFREQLRFNISGIKEIFWDEAEELVLDTLKKFTEGASNGETYSRKLFAEDAAQGFAFIDLMKLKYDVILMNPPFGEASAKTKEIFQKQYPEWNKNLLCAFIDRMLETINEDGSIGVIFDRTAIVKKTYENFRKEILIGRNSIFGMADTGWEVLDANVETTTMIFQKNYSEIRDRQAIFCDVRKVPTDEKGQKLLELIRSSNLNTKEGIYFANPREFEELPNSVIGYDIPKFSRHFFIDLVKLDGYFGHAGQGHAIKMDEFSRYFWEIEHKFINNINKDWVLAYNGGVFSYFYLPSRLIIYWAGNADRIRKHKSTRWSNADLQFSEGIGYGKRGEFLDAQILRRKHLFTVEGLAIFPNCNKWRLLSILNSSLVQYLLNTYCGQHKHAGYLNLLPIPVELSDIKFGQLENCSSYGYFLKSNWYLGDETNYQFSLPWILQFYLPDKHLTLKHILYELIDVEKAKEKNLKKISSEIDKTTLELYGVTRRKDIDIIEKAVEKRPIDVLWNETKGYSENQKKLYHVESLLSFWVGCIFGRWDALNGSFYDETFIQNGDIYDLNEVIKRKSDELWEIDELISEPMKFVLTSEEIQTSSLIEYPYVIDSDGIIPLDKGHPEDLIKRIVDAISITFGVSKSNIILKEIEDILGNNLEKYFEKNFSISHLNLYFKRPIYWQLSSRNNNYSLLIYYHRLTSDTLFLALRKYVDPKVGYEETKLKEMKEKLESEKDSLPRSKITKLEKEIENKADFVMDIKEFRKTLEKIAQKYNPNFDDGVILNMAPLHELIPWKEPAKYWKELEEGKYDWAHLAMKYWPERVKEKCKKDKSLAIAHGLEELYGAD